jgi:hypothetical protein
VKNSLSEIRFQFPGYRCCARSDRVPGGILEGQDDSKEAVVTKTGLGRTMRTDHKIELKTLRASKVDDIAITPSAQEENALIS